MNKLFIAMFAVAIFAQVHANTEELTTTIATKEVVVVVPTVITEEVTVTVEA